MLIEISEKNNIPFYRQIYNQIRYYIINGLIEQGRNLPSIRQLAKNLNISVITIKKAYDELEQSGYINTRQGKGTFVSNFDINQKILKNKIETKNKLQQIISESKLLGLKDEDIISIVKKILENQYENKRKMLVEKDA